MEPSGIIFNLQKFSLNDGPGIRTVVFFKGCPLRCKWCSNPESQNPQVETMADAHDSAKQEVVGQRRTVSSVVEECLQDAAFYEESGGGVTLSGGEPLAQPEFCLALLRALKEKGLHTAVETTGCCQPGLFQEAAAYIDLFLFDSKHWEEERHRAGTGVSQSLPLGNLTWAIAAGKQVLPRLPVIPGYNDSLADAAGFGAVLKRVGAKEVQLLPFHQFGEGKYQRLGKQYEYADVPALHPEELEEFREVLERQGLHAFF